MLVRWNNSLDWKNKSGTGGARVGRSTVIAAACTGPALPPRRADIDERSGSKLKFSYCSVPMR